MVRLRPLLPPDLQVPILHIRFDQARAPPRRPVDLQTFRPVDLDMHRKRARIADTIEPRDSPYLLLLGRHRPINAIAATNKTPVYFIL